MLDNAFEDGRKIEKIIQERIVNVFITQIPCYFLA